MTKIQAILRIMEDNGGVATLDIIYNNIEKYYPSIKSSIQWQAGIRGVLYREVGERKLFKKIGVGIYALQDYIVEQKPKLQEDIRLHSFIEGLCIELGNFNGYHTYTADPSSFYRDNLKLKDLTSLQTLPKFSYDNILEEATRIDVIWLNKKGLVFPQKIFEVVDSIGTLNGAFNRCLQLQNFRSEFFIIAPEKHRKKFEKTINLEIHKNNKERFRFINYDEIQMLYDSTIKTKDIDNLIFG